MTGAQRSYLKTLSEEPTVPVDEPLTKAVADAHGGDLRGMKDRGR